MSKCNVRNELQNSTIEENQQFYKDNESPVAIAGINLSGDINISMMIRTASLYGVSKFHIVGRRRYDKRGAVGMDKYISVHKHASCKGDHNEVLDVAKTIQILQDFAKTYTMVFLEQVTDENLLEYSKTGCTELSTVIPLCGIRNAIISDNPVMFVVGNENSGIPIQIMMSIPGYIVEIPQRGVGRSHNVAVSLGTVLWEYFREEM